MNKTKRFLVWAAILVPITIIIGYFTDLKAAFAVLFSVLLVILYMLYKDKVGREVLVAFLFSIALTSYYVYEYSSFNVFFGRINLFPLISWTFGLVLLREIYDRIKSKYKYLISIFIYWLILFLSEFVGFHLLEIQLASNYPSLFGLGIIHAPPGMKTFYLLAGPVYLLVSKYLRVGKK